MNRRRLLLLCSLVLGGGTGTAMAQDSAAASPAAAGRVAGTVVDRDTGRPLAGALVQLLTPAGATVAGSITRSTLDGRYRTPDVPPGRYALKAAMIGFTPLQYDSVLVTAGEATVLDLGLKQAATVLGAITVEAEVDRTPVSEAGMLALRQLAPVASDAVSREAITRAPDSRAADAVARLPGVSIVENKFVVIRGLSERYANTLLNGVDLPSPEPLKKVVPLDIFPASLIESITTTKSATPDKPGDFSGGSVEIQTKEFPENTVIQASISQGYQSTSTFREFPLLPRSLSDHLGFDDGRRAMPLDVPEATDPTEAFAEAVRNEWTPPLGRAPPNLGLGFNIGGQTKGQNPLGYVLSWTYSSKNEYVPGRISRITADAALGTIARAFIYDESFSVVDWGAILNLSRRFGASSKLGWRNLYTRNAEETALQNRGINLERDEPTRSYQMRYVARDFAQTQLSGEHLLGFLWQSRLDWKATGSLARRDEPDNRQVEYIRVQDTTYAITITTPSYMAFRFLDDRLASGQLDWTLPISLRGFQDAQFKIGSLYRLKVRDFDSRLFGYRPNSDAPGIAQVMQLPPWEAFSPELVGTAFILDTRFGQAEPYTANDEVAAAYLMADIPVLPFLRVVGGVRAEDWRIELQPGRRGQAIGDPITRHNRDLLWSGNLTVKASSTMNVRLAAFRSIARPDSRELSPDNYTAVTGDCQNQGNPELVRTVIANADVRWEFFPRAGELISFSGFYKDFRGPIVELFEIPNFGRCAIKYINAASARNLGAEFEVRKGLGPFTLGLNLTYVSSRVRLGLEAAQEDAKLPLQGQSPFLVNASVGFSSGGLNATALYNLFTDRVVRYGLLITGVGQMPHLYELGRGSVDAKVQQRVGPLNLTVAGKNLTNQVAEFYQDTQVGRFVSSSRRSGVSVTLGAGYDF